ncbi:MAG TPA: hypothetical protein VLS27_10700 [Gammaproteobacteria bacterium]|nr:hypothetical protein [Gammaproteobacteria bacterium]
MTFARPSQLDKLEKVLPAGVYSVESENDVLDGMILPDCLRTSLPIHLNSTSGSPGHSQTLTTPWQALEVALLRNWSPAVASTEPGLDEMLLDPTIRLLMRSDGVSEAYIRDLVSRLPQRNLSHVKSE